jgi:hypothetical protein
VGLTAMSYDDPFDARFDNVSAYLPGTSGYQPNYPRYVWRQHHPIAGGLSSSR